MICCHHSTGGIRSHRQKRLLKLLAHIRRNNRCDADFIESLNLVSQDKIGQGGSHMPIAQSIPTRRIYVSPVLVIPELLEFSRPKTDLHTYFFSRRTHSMVKEIDFMAPLSRNEGFAWVTIGSNFNMFSELRLRHLKPHVAF